MKINIKEFFEDSKVFLKDYTMRYGIDKKVALAIVDMTSPDDVANQIYIRKKVEDFAEMGWPATVYKVPFDSYDTIPHEGLKSAFQKIGNGAVIIQMPTDVPAKIRETIIESYIRPESDCDGFRKDSKYIAATPYGIMYYLRACGFRDFSGKRVVIVGRSEIVGKPLALEFMKKNATVTVCHSKTSREDMKDLLEKADFVVCATGHYGVVRREDCPKAIVIDVGINRIDGHLKGDFIENEDFVSEDVWSTPVPGGVGLLTRYALMENTVRCTARNNFPGDIS